MSVAGWVMIGVGGWVVLSLPMALLIAAMVDTGARVPGEDLPVITDADRSPLPPHPQAPALRRRPSHR